MSLPAIQFFGLTGNVAPFLPGGYAHANHIARRQTDPDFDVIAQFEKIVLILARAARDMPPCILTLQEDAEECEPLLDYNTQLQRTCAAGKFEDEQLGVLKCTCDAIKSRNILKDASKKCAEAFCKGADVEKVLEIQQTIFRAEDEQCGLLKDYARVIRDGFTVTRDGATLTVPGAGSRYPSTAFDFITETETGKPAPTDNEKKTTTSTSTRAPTAAPDAGDEEDDSSNGGSQDAEKTQGADKPKDDDVPRENGDSGAATFGVKGALTVAFAFLPVIAAMTL